MIKLTFKQKNKALLFHIILLLVIQGNFSPLIELAIYFVIILLLTIMHLMTMIKIDELEYQIKKSNPIIINGSYVASELIKRIYVTHPCSKTLQEQLDDAINNQDFERAREIQNKIDKQNQL